jgi:hypothetical protein
MTTSAHPTATSWEAPAFIPRDEVIAASNAVLAMPQLPLDVHETIMRITTLGLAWDIGLKHYIPDHAHAARGRDGKKIGLFLMHGGAGDYKSVDAFARVFAEKFGYTVVSMTFPGRLYLDDPSHDWPGDTINADGSVRTPQWLTGEHITPDQYDVISDGSMRVKYGTRTLARAKPGTCFYDRMAAWPAAFEEAMIEACTRYLPAADLTIYAHGHSTGGPFIAMLSQRVSNIAGLVALENSIFAYIGDEKERVMGLGAIEGFDGPAESAGVLNDLFNDLYIRTWRDTARYRGPEALGQEGPSALMRLPWLMEEVLEAWERGKPRPQFKAEYSVTANLLGALEAGARAVAARLNYDDAQTSALIDRYLGYTRELTGPGVKPVPPILFGLAKDSRDNSPQAYRDVIEPMLRKLNPAPRVATTRFGAGVHVYSKPEEDLPNGIAPAAAKFYNDAIMNGFYER